MATTIIRGSEGVILRFPLGVAGIDHTTAGLVVSTITNNEATPTVYTQAAGNIEAVTTLGTYSAPTSGRCRLSPVDATNHPTTIELQLPNARFAVANSSRLQITVTGGGLPTAGINYEVDLKADANVEAWRGSTPNALNSGRVATRAEVIADGTIVAATFGAGAITATVVADNTITAAKIASNAITAAKIADNALSAGKIADGAFDVSKFTMDFFSTVQAGLASEGSLTVIAGYVDTEVAAIKTVTDKIDTMLEADGSDWQFTEEALANGGGGGGGGDATLAKQNEIITILQGNQINPLNALTENGNLILYNRRTYNGTAHANIQFPTLKDYTSATSINLKLHSKENVDDVYQTLTATAASDELITATGTIDLDDLPYTGCPLTSKIGYTLTAVWSGNKETVATGSAYVYQQPE